MISYAFPHLGKINSQKQNEAEPRPQTCSSFDYTDNTKAREPLADWGSEDNAETQVRGGHQEGALCLLILIVKSGLLKHFCDRRKFKSNFPLLQ